MKTIVFSALFITVAVFSWAAEWETYEVIDKLLTISEPGEPVIYENFVIFTAKSDLRRVGVAFAHENFSTIYWYRHLLITQDPLDAPIPPGKKVPDPYKESGLQFYVYQVPENINMLEYRLVINGLWTIDPVNLRTRRDPASGLTWSLLSIPPRQKIHDPLKGLPKGLNFLFKGPPGETVTVAGNFNGWDPFMYELKEDPAGVYSTIIPLPPGTYQYVFFLKGQRYLDIYNSRRAYSREGNAVSEIVIQ
uniref:AMP-activated protein kinase glycogen-binding domain-containing protein n=1 Tax=uncultured bacterium contig00037 TaxID=1181525 RepID=A0A806JY31_9BACT|nr:hypothetical protein [uncultured bacterium contig00037]